MDLSTLRILLIDPNDNFSSFNFFSSFLRVIGEIIIKKEHNNWTFKLIENNAILRNTHMALITHDKTKIIGFKKFLLYSAFFRFTYNLSILSLNNYTIYPIYLYQILTVLIENCNFLSWLKKQRIEILLKRQKNMHRSNS